QGSRPDVARPLLRCDPTRLDRLQARPMPAEHHDRFAHFLNQVNKPAIMTESQMSRSGPGAYHGIRWMRRVQREYLVPPLATVNVDPVLSQVSCEHKLVIRRRYYHVHVRALLAFRIRPVPDVGKGLNRT